MAEFTRNSSNTRDPIQLELGLPASDELFRYVFGHAATGMALVSMEGKILKVNDSLCSLLGYTEEELLVRSVPEITHPEDWDTDLRQFEQIICGESHSYQLEKRYVRKDGELIWGILTVTLVRNREGSPACVVSQVQDITGRKLNEAMIEKLHNKNQLIINAVSDGIFGVDEHLRTIFWNDAAERITGYSEEEMIGKDAYMVLSGPAGKGDSEASAGSSFYRSMLEGVFDHNASELFYKKTGESFPVEYMTSPICESGRMIGVVITFKDITERLKTEEMLRKSEKLSVVGQLAAGVAHEIRNPLTSLKGFIQLLRAGAADKEEYYEIMLSELSRIELIITEMLVLAKPQMLRFRPESVEKIVGNVVTLLESQAILSNIQFATTIEHGLPLVMCEENQLKQTFINLIQNAMESMPEGGRIDIQVKAEAGDCVRIVVKDRGCGISEEVLARLGEPFFTTKEKGTGLGIMVSYKIIEDHKGHMLVESKVGEGTVVSVTLPITKD